MMQKMQRIFFLGGGGTPIFGPELLRNPDLNLTPSLTHLYQLKTQIFNNFPVSCLNWERSETGFLRVYNLQISVWSVVWSEVSVCLRRKFAMMMVPRADC